jgi:hypothetical protein
VGNGDRVYQSLGSRFTSDLDFQGKTYQFRVDPAIYALEVEVLDD